MPRFDVNRSGELEAFVRVVEGGGFSPAARGLGMTPSAISKLVARLELRLGATLVHRSTRKLALTTEGQQLYDRGVRILADLDEAERGASAGAVPRGRVSLNASVAFGHHVLAPILPRFFAEYPQVTLDLALTDRVVDLLDERTDVAIRWGELPPSDLVARRLGETDQLVVASPDYLGRRGTPRHPRDLAAHDRLGWTYRRAVVDWPFRVDGRIVSVPVEGPMRAGDGETLLHLALSGVGLARLSRYALGPYLADRRLVPVLEKFNPGDVAPIHAVYLGKPGRLPARVRALLDFLEKHARIDATSARGARTSRARR